MTVKWTELDDVSFTARSFDLSLTFRPMTVMLGLYGDEVLLMCSDKDHENNLLLPKAEALALAERLHRYAEAL
jgi:hypothetical protein